MILTKYVRGKVIWLGEVMAVKLCAFVPRLLGMIILLTLVGIVGREGWILVRSGMVARLLLGYP